MKLRCMPGKATNRGRPAMQDRPTVEWQPSATSGRQLAIGGQPLRTGLVPLAALAANSSCFAAEADAGWQASGKRLFSALNGRLTALRLQNCRLQKTFKLWRDCVALGNSK